MSFYHLFSSVSTLLITYLIASTAVVAEPHPFLGPIYPPPINLLAEKLIQNTVANLSSSLIHVLRNGQSPWGNVSANTSSMSMHVASARDNRTLLDFNFASPALNKTGTQDVTADSVYRVGSVSKLFTVYALLLNAGGFEKWDDPVTTYVPELRWNAATSRDDDPVTRVAWSNVTVGALAAQLSGIGRDCTLTSSRYTLEFTNMSRSGFEQITWETSPAKTSPWSKWGYLLCHQKTSRPAEVMILFRLVPDKVCVYSDITLGIRRTHQVRILPRIQQTPSRLCTRNDPHLLEFCLSHSRIRPGSHHWVLL